MTRPRRAMSTLALMSGLAGAVAGCATFPELGHIDVDGGGPAPVLLPVEGLLAQADATPRVTEATGSALAGRAARLRARAALMRGPVHDPQTRERLGQAISAGQA